MSKIYNNIAVMYGCDSSEWEVSCSSGEYTASRIDENKYSVFEIFARFGQWHLVAMRKKGAMRIVFPEGSRPIINKNDFSVNVYGENIRFDFVYIMQHGTPGEDGLLQGYLEMLNIPFSSCSAFVSSVIFDKYSCKAYLRGSNIVKMAKDHLVRKSDNLEEQKEAILKNLKLPLFVKATKGGSSFGITKVKQPEDLIDAIKFAFKESSSVIIEEEISGRELTCAVYFDGKEVKTLPPIEIISENEYFDYDAKYNGHSQEICPAPISDDVSQILSETTKKIYLYFGCKGLIRIDYFYAKDGLYFLEVNPIPGMTSASLVPKMIKTAGKDITDFLTTIIENS